eukprot:609862-Pyramimonas_sp.AAC.2
MENPSWVEAILARVRHGRSSVRRSVWPVSHLRAAIRDANQTRWAPSAHLVRLVQVQLVRRLDGVEERLALL